MNYRDVASHARFEIQTDGVRCVLLNPEKKVGPESNVLAFGHDGELIWRLSPPLDESAWDGFVNIWLERDSELWVGSWSGFSLQIDPRTGRVLRELFTK